MFSFIKQIIAPVKLGNLIQRNFSVAKQEQLFQKFNQKEILNAHLVNSVLERNIQKRTERSQRGLFHGKQPKTGLQTCFSEKKSIRWWKVNVHEKYLWSDILQKKIRIQMSSKTLRTIDKYGGFDNYVLLTKPKNMDSLYGEYLRKLMMFKLKDPSFNIPYIQKSSPVKHSVERRRKVFLKRPVIWHPKEIRNTDMTQLRMKLPHNMSRKELEDFKVMEDLNEHPERITMDHPIVKREYEKQMQELKALEPERQKIMERLQRYRSKKTLEKIKEVCKQGQDEWENAQNIK
ncbi:hypothetical protein ABPG74_003332 [Tetrahymena malaccensis]